MYTFCIHRILSRRSEGHSGNVTSFAKNGINTLEHMQFSNGIGPGVRKIKNKSVVARVSCSSVLKAKRSNSINDEDKCAHIESCDICNL